MVLSISVKTEAYWDEIRDADPVKDLLRLVLKVIDEGQRYEQWGSSWMLKLEEAGEPADGLYPLSGVLWNSRDG